MKLDTADQLSAITKMLHWLVAIFMIALLFAGVYMVETEAGWLYPWHKSFGFLLLFIVIVRVAWRIKNGWPSPVGQYSTIELSLSKFIHWLLILGTLLLPISGLLMSYYAGHGIDMFGLEVIGKNIDPENPEKAIAHSKALASFFHSVHHWSGYIIIAAVTLHVVGALKHHFVDKDETMKRML
ncbi:cytochrome b561 [Sinobacterium caligoides]|uniref:Cytochrome b561 n=1 Tax=Sinobacterium caligoides TaxID=933926 RepID=A0A3N2DK63_9GAMM|nr:cytochrome b [Sinobacterium caligoides]ROS00167.1 cytochrome b561 [Sinobacterium caligoides]